MTWQPYVISILAGLGIGAIYGLISVKSPAPPIIALLGLVGILAGEMLVKHLRGQPDSLAQCLHRKDFAHDEVRPPAEPCAQEDRTV